jgi:GNAT superfamily N-acetyltransferase
MKESIEIRKMRPQEIEAISTLINDVFDHFIAPQYTKQGIDEFKRFIEPDFIALRNQIDSFTLVATVNEQIIGMIEIREYKHVSLLFIDAHHQKRGYSRFLLNAAIKQSRKVNPAINQFTVNASPNAFRTYQHLGFIADSEEVERKGIRYTPMTLSLKTYIKD